MKKMAFFKSFHDKIVDKIGTFSFKCNSPQKNKYIIKIFSSSIAFFNQTYTYARKECVKIICIAIN